MGPAAVVVMEGTAHSWGMKTLEGSGSGSGCGGGAAGGGGGGGGNPSRSGSSDRQAGGRGGHSAQTTLSCCLLAGPGCLLSWETPVSLQPVPSHRSTR